MEMRLSHASHSLDAPRGVPVPVPVLCCVEASEHSLFAGGRQITLDVQVSSRRTDRNVSAFISSRQPLEAALLVTSNARTVASRPPCKDPDE